MKFFVCLNLPWDNTIDFGTHENIWYQEYLVLSQRNFWKFSIRQLVCLMAEIVSQFYSLFFYLNAIFNKLQGIVTRKLCFEFEWSLREYSLFIIWNCYFVWIVQFSVEDIINRFGDRNLIERITVILFRL